MTGKNYQLYLKRLLFIHGTIIGRAHIKTNTPCQDYALTGSYRGRLIAVVCDGAGSAALSNLGAKFCANWLFNKLKHLKNKMTQAYKKKILSDLQEQLKNYALELSCNVKDLACTIVATVVSEHGIECIHLGDSILIAYNPEFSKFITPEMGGEFANETYFITNTIAPEKAMLYSKIYDGEILILCTDGVSSSLILRRTQDIAPLVHKLKKALENQNTAQAQLNLNQELLPLFQSKTLDDCGLALIYEHIQEIVSWDFENFISIYNSYEDLGDINASKRKALIIYHALSMSINKKFSSSNLAENDFLISISMDQDIIDQIHNIYAIPKKTIYRTLKLNSSKYSISVKLKNKSIQGEI